MENFLKDIYSMVTTVVIILIAFVCISYLIYLYDESLATYFMKYVFPIFFIVVFISSVKDKFHE